MKSYPLKDVEFTYTGDRLHFDLLLLENGSFGLKIINSGDGRLNIELDKARLPPVRIMHLGFCEQDGIDFLKSVRNFLKLIDAEQQPENHR